MGAGRGLAVEPAFEAGVPVRLGKQGRDGRIGDLVVAANDGVVTLARDCYSSGNTILIHHGAELYSAYFHLSHMDVKPGANVHRGQKIGEVGKTGRVTGPHLHFGVKLAGHYVDPESLLRLDFERAP